MPAYNTNVTNIIYELGNVTYLSSKHASTLILFFQYSIHLKKGLSFKHALVINISISMNGDILVNL